MYRREIILARIYFDRGNSTAFVPQIAGLNRVSFARYRYRTQSIDCCARFLVSPFDEGPLPSMVPRQSLRGITALSV